MDRLTKEQAAIISAYTGVTCCNFSHVHKAIEDKLGHPVFTHQMGSQEFMDKVQELFKQDFLDICYNELEAADEN